MSAPIAETETPPEVREPQGTAPTGTRRNMVAWAGIVALVASAVMGSNVFSVRDRLLGSASAKPAAPATSRDGGTTPPSVGPSPSPATSLRSQPWWQDVGTLDGYGAASSSTFSIIDSAIQWRVTWTCGSGHLLVRAPKRPTAVVDGTCPGGAPGYATQSGPMNLQVTADGPWHLQIAQQIDTPLVEPPSPAMTAAGAAVVATGTFYRIDRTGTGKVTLYRQADGRSSLRLEDFFVTPTADLELRVSTVPAPHSSQEAMAARSELVAGMDVTAGSLNYIVPSTIDPAQFRSVYVWCAATRSAYAAASLVPAR